MSRSTQHLVIVLSAILSLAGIACSKVTRPKAPKADLIEIVRTFPHDSQAFTQGLVFHQGYLYEGTGIKGRSQMRKLSLEDGSVIQSAQLGSNFFGEGITILGDRLYQLTWQEKTCFVYDVNTLEPIKEISYDYEGWGITDNEELLIVSDGTPTIRFVAPHNFGLVRQIEVTLHDRKIEHLNELEMINGEIWANIWKRDRIARINPENGQVIGLVDAGNLYPQELRAKEDALNGIAHDPEDGRIFLTGKNWPNLFEVRVAPKK